MMARTFALFSLLVASSAVASDVCTISELAGNTKVVCTNVNGGRESVVPTAFPLVLKEKLDDGFVLQNMGSCAPGAFEVLLIKK